MGRAISDVKIPSCGSWQRRLCAALLLGSLLAGCGTSNYARSVSSERLYRTVFTDIAEVYLEEVEIPALALAGFSGLSRIEPRLEASLSGGVVTVAFAGEEVGRLAFPPDDDGFLPGSQIAALLSDLEARSETLKTLSQDERDKVFLDRVFGGLDEFSSYDGPEMRERRQGHRDGASASLGASLRWTDRGFKVLELPEDSSAQDVPFRQGDLLVAIDGTMLSDLGRRAAYDRLRGPPGSQADLTIIREGQNDPETLIVARQEYDLEDVTTRRFDGLVYLRVWRFSSRTATSLGVKLWRAKRDLGPALKGVVLDLRNNGGGLLDSAVTVADLFVREGLLASVDGRHPDSLQYFNAEPDDRLGGAPLVVLINGETAAGASIVAAALQDRQRAVVVGSVSSGYGTIQTVLRTPNDGEITLTWALSYAPSGYALDGRGVLPDICTAEMGLAVDEIAARLHAGSLPIDRRRQQSKVDRKDRGAMESLRALCPAHDRRPEIDLEVAKRLLNDPTLFSLVLHRRMVDQSETARAASAGSSPLVSSVR